MRAQQFADGFFDTQLWLNLECAFWNEHWKRICRSFDILGLNPINELQLLESIRSQIKQQVDLNNSFLSVKLLFWRQEGNGLKVSALANVDVEIRILKIENLALEVSGVSLYLSEFLNPVGHKKNEDKIKSFNYLSAIEALKEAQKQGFEDVLLKDKDGLWVEAAYSNIIALNYKEQVVVTPATGGFGAFKGVTRDWCLDYFKEHNWTVKEYSFDAFDAFDEVFLTSSIRGIASVCKIGKRDLIQNLYAQKLRKMWLDLHLT